MPNLPLLAAKIGLLSLGSLVVAQQVFIRLGTPRPPEIGYSTPNPSPVPIPLPTQTDNGEHQINRRIPEIRPPVQYMPPTPNQSGIIDLSDWEYLISFRPPTALQKETLRYQQWRPRLWGNNAYTNWFVQRLDDAVGSVNLDYYPVLIRKMPLKNGVRQTPQDLLVDLRRNLNNYISDGYTSFVPYNHSWESACSSEILPEALGCYFYIRISLAYTQGLGRDDGAVMISEITPQYWIFTTVFAAGHRDGEVFGGSNFHPITGNRQFGYKEVPEGYIFYTKGVDRLSDSARALGNAPAEMANVGAFSSGDRLWRTFQNGLVAEVTKNGGEAVAGKPVQRIESWEYAVKRYHNPSVQWVDRLVTGQSYPYAN
jgi:hypothetical protein